MTKLKVLVAEDNLDIAENIGDFLALNDHQVDYAYDGEMAVNLMETESFDVIVMDIMMPKLNGLHATQKIRQLPEGDVPILMLTAKDTINEKLNGFEAGADDYIVKPFDMAELYARILAHARKTQKSYTHTVNVNGVFLDRKQQNASVNDTPLLLNPTTFKIMWQLTKGYPTIVAKKDIEFSLWGEFPPDNDILRSHIYNLRKSLAKCTSSVTVVGKHGQGYQLAIENQ